MINFPILSLAALVPLVVGFIWYHPAVFGNAWMQAAGVNPEQAKNTSMVKTMGLTFLMSFLLAMIIQFLVIHQYGLFGVVADTVPDPTGVSDHPDALWLKASMETYGTKFRTFKHGMFHGFLAGVFFVLPLITVNGLYEQKSSKYIFLNTGFWTLCIMLMGGIICQFA